MSLSRSNNVELISKNEGNKRFINAMKNIFFNKTNEYIEKTKKYEIDISDINIKYTLNDINLMIEDPTKYDIIIDYFTNNLQQINLQLQSKIIDELERRMNKYQIENENLYVQNEIYKNKIMEIEYKNEEFNEYIFDMVNILDK